MIKQVFRQMSSENWPTFLLSSWMRPQVKTFQLLNKDYLINHRNFLISRASCKKLRQNEIAISVSFLVKDFKSREGRDGVKNDNISFFFNYPWRNFLLRNIGVDDILFFAINFVWNVKTASASTLLLCRIMYFLSIFEYAYFQYFSCPLIFKDFTSLPILSRTYPIRRPFNQLFFNEKDLPYFRRYHRSDVLHMAGRQASFFTELTSPQTKRRSNARKISANPPFLPHST